MPQDSHRAKPLLHMEPLEPRQTAAAAMPQLPAGSVPCLVLDTNVVLDWLLFGEPGCRALQAAIAAGQMRWLASVAMRGELEHVLGRGLAATRLTDPASILRAWDQWVTPVAAAPSRPTPLRCSDRDDQKFIDLALATGATALLSRDRAVLKLARRARALGLDILTGEAWCRRTSWQHGLT